MLLTLVIILVLIGSAVVGSIYSNFLVFYENFTETENYHKARYASIAAIERAELVIKQREPGYIGSGGRILSQDQIGSESDKRPNSTGFSYLSDNNSNPSTIFRKINSRADRIPAIGNGNVEKLLAADDSTDYNMMDYENTEIFLLHYDKSNGSPYSHPNNIIQTKINGIKVALRLPPYIQQQFGDLNTGESLIQGLYKDDAIVDRQLKGNYDNKQFTIFATQNAAGILPAPNDSTIRESNLNNTGIILEFQRYWNPKSDNNTPPTIISQDDNAIRALGNETNQGFRTIFSNNDNHFSNLQLRFSLLNLVLGAGEFAYRYPFLEYYVEFIPKAGTPVILSDKYFTIQTEGNFGDYKIDTIIYKPTITESILKSFTIIL